MTPRTSLGWRAIALLTALGFAGCLPLHPTGRPAWVLSRQHPQFGQARFLIGVGEGRSPAEAALSARRDWETQVSRLAKPLALAGDPAASPEALARCLPEPDQGFSWSSGDGSRHAALVALDRTTAAANLRSQIERAEQAVADLLAAPGAGDPSTPDPAADLRSLLQALGNRFRAEQLRAFAKGVDPTATLDPAGPGADELWDRCQQVLATIELKVVQGDWQRLSAQGALPQPLVAGTYWVRQSPPDRYPARDLPLSFSIQQLGAPIVSGVKTSEFGTAALEVRDLPGPAQETGLIAVSLDAEQFLQGAGISPEDPRFAPLRDKASAIQAQFHFLKADASAPRVALVIRETALGELTLRSQVADQLSRQVEAQGLDILPAPPGPGDPPVAETVAGYAGQARAVITGTVETEVSQMVSEGFFFCKTEGRIQVWDVGSGRLLGEAQQATQGAGQDEYAAYQRSVDSFIRKVSPAILKAIQGR